VLAQSGRERFEAVALSGRDGAVLWRSRAGVPLRQIIAAGDLDGDRLADVVLVPATGVAAAVSGANGKVLWRTRRVEHPRASTAADVDGDGVADVCIADRNGAFLASGRTGAPIWKLESAAATPALVDLDGDGVLEVLLGEGETLAARSARDASPRWSVKLAGPPGWCRADADVDGDGQRDAVVGLSLGRISAFSGRDGAKLWDFKAGIESAYPPVPADCARRGWSSGCRRSST
jgi:hypothetical protein